MNVLHCGGRLDGAAPALRLVRPEVLTEGAGREEPGETGAAVQQRPKRRHNAHRSYRAPVMARSIALSCITSTRVSAADVVTAVIDGG